MPLVSHCSIDLRAAQFIASACEQAAADVGIAVCIAVTDRQGQLLSFTRMDGAPMLSSGLAQDKAWSVAMFNGLPTDAWWALIGDEPALAQGIVKTERLIVFGGGKPVLMDGALVGAVGVSGGSEAQDVLVAAAGADALPGEGIDRHD